LTTNRRVSYLIWTSSDNTQLAAPQKTIVPRGSKIEYDLNSTYIYEAVWTILLSSTLCTNVKKKFHNDTFAIIPLVPPMTILRRPKRPNYTPFARRPRRVMYAKWRLNIDRFSDTVIPSFTYYNQCTVVDNNIPTTLHRDEPQRNRKQSAHTLSQYIYMLYIILYILHPDNLYPYCSNVNIRLLI